MQSIFIVSKYNTIWFFEFMTKCDDFYVTHKFRNISHNIYGTLNIYGETLRMDNIKINLENNLDYTYTDQDNTHFHRFHISCRIILT